MTVYYDIGSTGECGEHICYLNDVFGKVCGDFGAFLAE